MQKIYPLILCGGVGTRLWPLSRTEHPKQFQKINGNSDLTFFHATVQRQRTSRFHDPVISVSQSHVGTVMHQLDEIQCQARIIAEPLARNTGPAVLAAALTLSRLDHEAIMCVLPSDHMVQGNLSEKIAQHCDAARQGRIVLFGVPPEYPETGYGYIVDGGAIADLPGAHSVMRFVEKPPLAVATALIASGNAYWSSGISLFRADVLISEYRRLDPGTYRAVVGSLEMAKHTEHAIYLEGSSFAGAASHPTESAVFENSPLTVVAPLSIGWNDVGAWSALHQIAEKNESGNVLSGDVICIDSRNSYVRSSGRLVAVVGMEDVVVVDTDDALLVTTRHQAQQVKQVVKQLETIKRRELAEHVRSEMNWGEVKRIQEGPGYQLRLMTIRPGTSFTIAEDTASHRLLTIAEGAGSFKGEGDARILRGGDTIELAPGASGLLSNDSAQTMEIVEVRCELPMADVKRAQPALHLATV